MTKEKLANLALLVAAFIWGTAFVAQSVGMDYIGPFTFLWVRSMIGAGSLLIVILVRNLISDKKKIQEQEVTQEKKEIQKKEETAGETGKKTLIIGGICCGVAMCFASGLQQVGMQYTTVGNAGFITSMYMLLVPIFSVVLRKKVPGKIWACIGIAAVGLYFLSISEGFSISKGDFLVLLCAICFAVHVMVVDYFAPLVDGVQLSCVQFVVTSVLAMGLAFAFETPRPDAILAAMIPLLYTGVLSSGVAFTLQILAQKYAQPTVATLFMSMESVFSLLGGIVVLQQFPTGRELFGCILVFFAVVCSQIKVHR